MFDNKSRFTWFYPLKLKSDFFSVFLRFQSMVENQCQQKYYSFSVMVKESLSTRLSWIICQNVESNRWSPVFILLNQTVWLNENTMHQCRSFTTEDNWYLIGKNIVIFIFPFSLYSLASEPLDHFPYPLYVKWRGFHFNCAALIEEEVDGSKYIHASISFSFYDCHTIF